jgi:leader peptidase (prepilin peptidase)/N-methyltransferase
MVVVGALGAVIGSFLTVVVHRVPAGVSVRNPPSACLTCAEPIRVFDRIPVFSWLLLRGRCRQCDSLVSVRNPLVELATLVIFAALTAWQWPAVTEAPSTEEAVAAVIILVALLYFAAISISLTVIDCDTHRLPNAIVLPSYAVLGALLGSAALVAGAGERAAWAAAGAGILFAGYLSLALLSPRGMGMGDVKLAGVVGLMTGFSGVAALIVGTMAAFALGSLVSIALMLARRAGRDTRIAFGPWMLAGAWIGIVFGDPVVRWYLALFGFD